MSGPPLRSGIYEGRVRHRRFSPVPHAFSYRLAMLYLDLAEEDRVFRGRWFWSAGRRNIVSFRREDHLGDPATALDESVRRLVEERTGRRPAGPVRLLTHPRWFGHVFNPVSFYYCFDAADRRVETVVAEVDNTPWGERHCYVLGPGDAGTGARHRWRFPKEFHVSPFLPMDVSYDWRFTEPRGRLAVHMDLEREGRRVFDATMHLERREIAGTTLASVLLRFPFQTLRVLAAIYGQALRLKLKGVPFFPHPSKRGPAAVMILP